MAGKLVTYFILCWLVVFVCICPTQQHQECRVRIDHHCDGSSGKQLSHIQICDNVNDCPRGEDEADCGFPLVEGSVWKADIQYDKCTTNHKPEDVTMTIMKVDRSDPTYPKVQAEVVLKHTHDGKMKVFVANSVGHYSYTDRLIWLANNDTTIEVRCCFDEGHLDKCHGAMHLGEYALTDWHPCGEFTYTRIGKSSGERLTGGVVYKSALFVVAVVNIQRRS